MANEEVAGGVFDLPQLRLCQNDGFDELEVEQPTSAMPVNASRAQRAIEIRMTKLPLPSAAED